MKICLVGGTGRSGTTLLSNIFSNHPDIAVAPESRFLIDPDGIIDFYNAVDYVSPFHYDLKLRRLEALLKSLESKHLISRAIETISNNAIPGVLTHKLSCRYAGISTLDCAPKYAEMTKRLIKRLTAFEHPGHWVGMKGMSKKRMRYSPAANKDRFAKILGGFLREFMQDVTRRQNRQNFLEKNTWNILWYDKILELLPEARLVHIYRDPRDVVASYSHQTWMPKRPDQCALIYSDLMDRWNNIKAGGLAESYFEVSLEQLVSNPESTLRAICRFWGIEWVDNLLQVDLSKSNTGRWRKDLSKDQIAQVSSILGQHLIRLGYV